TLGMSANESMGEEERDISKKEMGFSITIGILMVVGLFVVLPLFAVGSVRDWFPNASAFVAAEGVMRIAILIVYITVVSRIKQMRRVFEYHGAEHKTIHALESGLELTPANVKKFSSVHPRCGTSFLLIVMVLAIIVFSFVPIPRDWTNIVYVSLFILSRIIGIPLVVGLSYEVIKYAGRHKDSSFMKVVMYPGMILQKLTTREPDESQIEVAIAALDGVAALEPIEMDHGGKADVEVMA
ncbi:MAG: DUF1385 domain-containing protein, partial [Actinomycetota bacterium]